MPERHVAKLAVILTIIDHFDDFILEDQGSPQERDLVVLDVGSVLDRAFLWNGKGRAVVGVVTAEIWGRLTPQPDTIVGLRTVILLNAT